MRAAASFAGVPILVKDLVCPVRGVPEGNGNRLLRDRRETAGRSSVLVERLRRAGFVVLGSSTTAEFGATITTETSGFGPCRNPWALDRSSGGSSGGAAAAVAAGFVPVAHGNDASGSLRIPASFCGVLGYKPSRGRISDNSDPASWFGLASHGPMARSVRDLIGLTQVLAGDPITTGGFTSGWGRASERSRSYRVGVLDAQQMAGLSAPVCEAMRVTEDALSELGHDLARVAPEETPYLDADFQAQFALVAATAVATQIAYTAGCGHPDLPEHLEPSTESLVRLARRRSADDLAASHAWLMGFRARMRSWCEERGFDALVSPVVTTPPSALGVLADPYTGGRSVAEIMRFTAQFNVTGQPAMSLPVFRDGLLPIGVQVAATTAGLDGEGCLFDIAGQLEADGRLKADVAGRLPIEPSASSIGGSVLPDDPV